MHPPHFTSKFLGKLRKKNVSFFEVKMRREGAQWVLLYYYSHLFHNHLSLVHRVEIPLVEVDEKYDIVSEASHSVRRGLGYLTKDIK